MKTGASDLRDLIYRKFVNMPPIHNIETEISNGIPNCPIIPKVLSTNPLIYLISDIKDAKYKL